MKKEEMYLTNIKFKNVYVIDLSSNEIIFNLMSVNNKKHKKIQNNEKIWQEILHHSHGLLTQYKSEYSNKFDSTHAFYNFVKIECTSTYPRLTFVIKFLPILNGISLIHVYSQSKLSRTNDSETSISQTRTYKELEIIYGNEIRNSSNIEFRYTEPKKLKEIEKFFVEFFILINQNESDHGLFFNASHELKYFDYSLFTLIDEVTTVNKTSSFETILNKIRNKLYETLLNGSEIDRGKFVEKLNNGYALNILSNNVKKELDNSDSHQDISLKKIKENNSDIAPNMNVNTNYLSINREFILKNIFPHNEDVYRDNPNMFFNSDRSIHKTDNTLILSNMNDTQNRYEDGSFLLYNQFSEISQIDKLNDDNENGLNSFLKQDQKQKLSDNELGMRRKNNSFFINYKNQTSNSLSKLQQNISYIESQVKSGTSKLDYKRMSHSKGGSPSPLFRKQESGKKYLKMNSNALQKNKRKLNEEAVLNSNHFIKNNIIKIKNEIEKPDQRNKLNLTVEKKLSDNNLHDVYIFTQGNLVSEFDPNFVLTNPNGHEFPFTENIMKDTDPTFRATEN